MLFSSLQGAECGAFDIRVIRIPKDSLEERYEKATICLLFIVLQGGDENNAE